jgi:hypothetical protein
MPNSRARWVTNVPISTKLDALPRGQAALRVDLRDALLAAARQRLLATPVQLALSVFAIHDLLPGPMPIERRSVGTPFGRVKAGATSRAAASAGSPPCR